jgi:regulator of sigma E protease
MIVFDFLCSVFAFIVVISILVFVHEIGHYLACVWCKVRVASFSIGMGKEIYGWNNKRNERWKISLLPIGGYVMMYGDADASSGKADKKMIENLSDEEKRGIIYFQPPWKKFIIAFMGPFFSLMFGVIVLTGIYFTAGIKVISPIIGNVLPDTPADGILTFGDKILEINGKEINDFKDISTAIAINGDNEPLNIKIFRVNGTFTKTLIDNTTETKDITTEEYVVIYPKMRDEKDMFGNDIKIPFIGIAPLQDEYVIKLGIFKAFIESINTTYRLCKNTLIVLGQMISGRRNADDIGGPIKIAKYSSQSFRNGFRTTVYFMAVLSINLGLMNLLPIPILDGGALLFLVIQMIIRREIPEKIQEKLLNIGFVFLLFVMFFATINDIKGFFK